MGRNITLSLSGSSKPINYFCVVQSFDDRAITYNAAYQFTFRNVDRKISFLSTLDKLESLLTELGGCDSFLISRKCKSDSETQYYAGESVEIRCTNSVNESFFMTGKPFFELCEI